MSVGDEVGRPGPGASAVPRVDGRPGAGVGRGAQRDEGAVAPGETHGASGHPSSRPERSSRPREEKGGRPRGHTPGPSAPDGPKGPPPSLPAEPRPEPTTEPPAPPTPSPTPPAPTPTPTPTPTDSTPPEGSAA
ncbi:hypothetical protein GCM10012280_18240 [Wenjunlia tyrosinilytica]|uniref:Uncharacterized protein n=1 Tax=Wenjunlia tyrosinilytica TaxID=1544741 RepID=A0A918DWM7_9ACTN|nr:hypothetical protein GCM10012280_18240 [Wenjunlia tyrosinilytica]